MILCPHCLATVLMKLDNTCPNCGKDKDKVASKFEILKIKKRNLEDAKKEKKRKQRFVRYYREKIILSILIFIFSFLSSFINSLIYVFILITLYKLISYLNLTNNQKIALSITYRFKTLLSFLIFMGFGFIYFVFKRYGLFPDSEIQPYIIEKSILGAYLIASLITSLIYSKNYVFSYVELLEKGKKSFLLIFESGILTKYSNKNSY